MFKCYDCGRTLSDWESLYRWTESHGERLVGCYCGGEVDEADKCCECGEWFLPDEDYSDGMCHECATKLFNGERGMAYVAQNDIERDLIDAHYNITVSGFPTQRKGINALMDAFLNELGEEQEKDEIGEAHTHLKAVCLEDIDHWIDFLMKQNGDK